ncbi:unnamed protein product [Lampetra planeri]
MLGKKNYCSTPLAHPINNFMGMGAARWGLWVSRIPGSDAAVATLKGEVPSLRREAVSARSTFSTRGQFTHSDWDVPNRPRRLEPTEDGTAAVSIAVALLSRERRRRPVCDGLRCLPARPGPDDLLEQREQEEEEVGSQCRYREAA